MRCIRRQINKYLVMRAEQLKYVQAMSATSLPFLSFHLRTHTLSLFLCFSTSSCSLILTFSVAPPFQHQSLHPSSLFIQLSLYPSWNSVCVYYYTEVIHMRGYIHKAKFVFVRCGIRYNMYPVYPAVDSLVFDSWITLYTTSG